MPLDRFSRRMLLKAGLVAGGMTRIAFPQGNYIGGKTATSSLALARILNSMSYASLPPTPVKYAKMILASTLSSAAAGANVGSVRIIRELAKEQGGKGEATVWFDGAKLPVASTARVNAMLSDASASDDSDLRNVAHIGTCLTAVGLAVGERMNASGQETLSAMVAGYEAAGRITDAIAASTPSSDGAGAGAVSGSVGRGFHASAIVAFGGAVAASKLLRLTDEQMAQAIGITATTVGGLSIGTNSWAREYHAGNAALTSINAALAASRGYTVNPDMLEAPGGFLAVFTGGTPDARSLARKLNPGSDQGGSEDDYQIARYLAVKLVPGAHALHPAVEAAVNAARESGARPEDVAQILVAGPQSGLVAAAPPKDFIQAIHSLSYYIASAVADKDFSWVHAEPAMIERPVIGRLIGLVAQDPAPSPVRYQWPWGATVTIVTRSGARFRSTVDAPKGSAPRGIEWSDIEAKYRALMPQSKLPADRISEILRTIRNFEQVKSVSELTGLLS
ncbi:MAG: MmgE/PrpD family protein [Bryobacteraceae bacterium]|jgi:2-methylcitrate dehydratase PrpD